MVSFNYQGFIVSVCIFFIAVVVHEFGHYVGFRMFGIKPKIKFKWWGIGMTHPNYYRLAPFQVFLITLLGVYTGYEVIYFADYSLMIPYLLACLIDITDIIRMFPWLFHKRYCTMSVIDIMSEKIENVKEDLAMGYNSK